MNVQEGLAVNLKKLALVGSLLFFLNGCASTNNDTTGSTTNDYVNPADGSLVCKLPLSLEPIEPINTRDYEWIILNNSKIKEMLAEGENLRFFALTQEDFQNLSLTQQDILRYLRVQTEQLNRTVEYYSNESVDND